MLTALYADIERDGEGAMGHVVVLREWGPGHGLGHNERQGEQRHRICRPAVYERTRVGERTVL